jgi:hypothetical protein
MTSEPIEYSLQKAREALIQDPSVGEPGIDVQLVGDKVVLTGTVVVEGRRKSAEDIVRRHFPDREIANEIDVTQDLQPPTSAEDLR